jgi:multidrug resistance efflux pump
MKIIKDLIKKIRDPKILRIIIIVAIAIGVIGGFVFYEKSRDRVKIDNSLIQAPIVSISPQTPGTLVDLRVYDGEKVKKGDVLAIVGTQSLIAYQDGTIISTTQSIGGLASSQAPVVQMINPSDMRVAGTIDETKGLDEIKIGQVISFTVDALPGNIFWGYVDEVSPTAKQTQLQFSISSERPTQQFIVYARFDAFKYPLIKNGMSAKMTVYTSTP